MNYDGYSRRLWFFKLGKTFSIDFLNTSLSRHLGLSAGKTRSSKIVRKMLLEKKVFSDPDKVRKGLVDDVEFLINTAINKVFPKPSKMGNQMPSFLPQIEGFNKLLSFYYCENLISNWKFFLNYWSPFWTTYKSRVRNL